MLIQKNTEALAAIQTQSAMIPTKDELRMVLEQTHLQGIANCQALHCLTESLQKVDDRVRTWETTFLPEVVDRLPPRNVPASPESDPGESQSAPPTQPYSDRPPQEAASPDSDMASRQVARASSGDAPQGSQPSEGVANVLHRIQGRSLQSQSSRALAPFRSRQ